MGKTDYTKTENLLTEGLLKMSVDDLLHLADQSSSFKHPQAHSSVPSVQARTIILSFMEHDLELVSKVQGSHIQELGITPQELKGFLKSVKDLTQEDWVKLKRIRERLIAYKKELWEKIPHLSDEDLVNRERKKHINKRFNTRDKWLPLH